MAHADSPTKTCGEDGCGRTLRARGLCSTHYNRQYQPKRHAKHLVRCMSCGNAFESSRPDGKLCSDACRAAEYARRGWTSPRTPRPVGMPGTPWSAQTRARAKLRRAARGTRGYGVWVGGLCERCGHGFVSRTTTPDLGRYCSNACKRRARSSRRRSRMRGAHAERYSRHQIFERDGWRCHICVQPLLPAEAVPHPLAPTIDHLVPLAEGGEDCAANVRAAHFLCNSTRGERGGNEQLLLFG